LMNIIIFRDHITVFKIIGIVLIIVGIITIDL
jgi:multidrug transporter EmrE-like cation transporter